MARRIGEVCPKSVNRELSFLRRVFDVAIRDGRLETNPVKGVRSYRENSQRVRSLSNEEELAVGRGDGRQGDHTA